MAGEMAEFPGGIQGLAFNLEENSVGVIILGDYLAINEGDEVRSTGQLLSVPVGDAVLGRVLDPLGNPLDGKGAVATSHRRAVEAPAPGVADRQPVKEPLQTGIKAIDSMTPIGRGQRELIIGDRKTGKTAICIDTIINQKQTGEMFLRRHRPEGIDGRRADRGVARAGAMDIRRSSWRGEFARPAAIRGLTRAARWLSISPKGEHSLVIYDDLSKQAVAYRELALMPAAGAGRLIGRHLLLPQPVAGAVVQAQRRLGGGSLTALPIVETLEGEVSGTFHERDSITDGQIYLQPDLFFLRQRPAMNRDFRFASARGPGAGDEAGGRRIAAGPGGVSRAGGVRPVGDRTRPGDPGPARSRYRMTELLKQGLCNPLPVTDQVLAIYAGTRGHMDKIPVGQISAWERKFLEFIHAKKQDLWDTIEAAGDIELDKTTGRSAELEAAVAEFQQVDGGKS